jgi:hypothetical protein
MIREYIRVLLKSDDVKWAKGSALNGARRKVAVIEGDLKKPSPLRGATVGNRLR